MTTIPKDDGAARLLRRGIFSLALLALLTAGYSVGLKAHEGMHGVVMERMNLMIANDEARAEIENMLYGDGVYDAAKIKDDASAIEGRSGDALTVAFPEGSLKGTTFALPDIWTDWDTFNGYAQDLKSKAEKLETVAGSHPEKTDTALIQAFEEMSAACEACHVKFRGQ